MRKVAKWNIKHMLPAYCWHHCSSENEQGRMYSVFFTIINMQVSFMVSYYRDSRFSVDKFIFSLWKNCLKFSAILSQTSNGHFYTQNCTHLFLNNFRKGFT